MAWLQRGAEAFRGGGGGTATVPPMDGALRPNTLLQTAEVVLRIAAPDNLVVSGDRVLFSSGCTLHVLDLASNSARELRRFDHPIACLCAGEGLLVAGLEDGSLQLCRPEEQTSTVSTLGRQQLVCPTALAFRDADTLVVCQGSSRHRPDQWKRDLLEGQATGSVWEMSVADGRARMLAGQLGFPCGVAVSETTVVVSESWRHRLVRPGGPAVLADLPGYPARIAPAARGGYLLCVFAPRSQLIEFVLQEHAYRERMMRELDPDHWIAPTLSPARSALEPMQGGALRSHGILKPWAPTRSYGLLVRLDARFQPVASYHSRADGSHHGITSCVEFGSQVLVASRGGDAILALPLMDEP